MKAYLASHLPAVCHMDGEQVKKLLEAPLESLDGAQAMQLLQYLMKERVELKSEHLDLALRHRQFKRAVQIMGQGVRSPNLASLIVSILGSPVPLDSDFNIVLLFCVAAGVDVASVLKELGDIHKANVDSAMVIVIPLLLLCEDLSSVDASSAPQVLRAVVEAAKNGETLLNYVYFREKVSSETTALHEAKLSKLNEVREVVESPDVAREIREKANAITVQCKNQQVFRTDQVDMFKDKFVVDVDILETYLVESVQPVMRRFNSAITEVKVILDSIRRMVDGVNDFNNKIVKTFLQDPTTGSAEAIVAKYKELCVEYSSPQMTQGDFDSRLTSIQITSFLVAVLQLYIKGESDKALGCLKKFGEICETFESRLKQDIPQFNAVLCEPVDLEAKIQDPNFELCQSVKCACDKLLSVIYLCECGLLEAIVKEEAVLDAATATLYPKAHKDLFKKLVSEPMRIQAPKLRSAREAVLEAVTERASMFFSKVRGIPGVRRDTKYVDFEPSIQWQWPKVPGVTFPGTPQEVREVILRRSRIQDLLVQFALSPTTEMCRVCNTGLAAVVCPDCKKIVICRSCLKRLGKCPLCEKELV